MARPEPVYPLSMSTAPPPTVTVAPYCRGTFHAFRVFDHRTGRAFYFDTQAQAVAHARRLAA